MAITKVTNDLVAVNAIHGTLIADNAITAVHIAQNQVTAVQIADGSITSTQLGANSVDTAELISGSIDTIHIADDQVTTAKIADLNVTTGKIANNAITSAKIPDGSITATQLSSSAAPTFGTITTTGALRGPASFTIDPATVGDNTGTVVIAGNLQIDGTTTTVNSTTLSVADINITVASGAGNASAANNAGLTVAGAGATMLYQSSGDEFRFNKPLYVDAAYKTGTTSTFVGQLTNSGGKLRLQSDANRDIEIGDTNNADIIYVDTSAQKVGIGTSSPSVPLTVNNDTDHSDIAIFHAGGGTPDRGLKISTFSATNSNSGVELDAQHSTGAFKFSTAGTERIRIDSSGNVGIGVTAPGSKFEIKQTQSDTMTDAEAFLALKGNGGDGILMGNRNSSPFAAWIQAGYIVNIGTSHHYPLSLNPHGGNVGIGTVSPALAFHVHSKTSSDIVKFENDNGSFILGKTANLASIDLASDAGMRIRHSSTESAYFSADDVVFNNGSAAQNFRVESNGNTHAIYVDGTNNHIMIGNSTHQPVSQHNNQAGIGYNGAIGQTQIATTGDNAVMEIGKNQGTDGDLVVFRKQSSVIGSIGVGASELFIGSGDAHLWTSGANNAFLPASTSVGGGSDNALDLGSTGRRFKDAHIAGNVICGRIENSGSTITTNFHTAQKGFQVSFANGVANQKVKLILAATWWGDLTVRLTGTYSNQNMAGVLEKRYGTGLNAAANQAYSNESRVTESLGATADNFHLGDIEWDSGLGKWIIVITHRVSTGNQLAINVEGFCQAAADVTDLEGFTVSSVYTTDTTVYGLQHRRPAFAAILTSGQSVTGSHCYSIC